MADIEEAPSTSGKGKKKSERWIFTDDIVQDLLKILQETKTNMEGRGLDFEGDLVKLYSDLRTEMSSKHQGFGPKETTQPEIDIDEMSKEQYRDFKKKVDEEEKAIKLGYERVKAKVKKLRSGFQKCVNESTRSGSGRIVQDNWDVLVEIWGGSPGADPLDFGMNTMEGETKKISEDCTEANDDSGPPKKKQCASTTARFVDEKRKNLEKKLSTRQKESLMLETMREDVKVKKQLLAQGSSTTDEALVKIADSMQTLSQAILSGFNHLNAIQATNQYASPMQPQYGLPFHHPQQYPVQQQFSGIPSSVNPLFGPHCGPSRTPSPSTSTNVSEDGNEEYTLYNMK